MAADEWLQIALNALDQLAANGDGIARHAARAMRGSRRGDRPAVDDAPALAQIERLIAAGRDRATAINTVARALAGDPTQVAATAKRLRKKMCAKQVSSIASEGI